MRMDDMRESDNLEDDRGGGGRRGGGGMRVGGGIGIGTIAIALVAWGVFGINPLQTIGMLSGGGVESPVQQSAPPARTGPAADDQAKFVSRILASTEDVWSGIFRQSGRTYVPPKLRLFSGSEPTACGMGQAAMGPFYCPADSKVYLDMSFFNQLQNQLGARGDFAKAYVIAHEVGHHVQNLLGVSAKVDAARARQSERDANALSVRVELQADCYAGVWAAHEHQRLEPGDIEQAMNAASRIGDDTLQHEMQGRVVPDSFTHGTSAERVNWLTRGFKSGDPSQCDTFSATTL